MDIGLCVSNILSLSCHRRFFCAWILLRWRFRSSIPFVRILEYCTLSFALLFTRFVPPHATSYLRNPLNIFEKALPQGLLLFSFELANKEEEEEEAEFKLGEITLNGFNSDLFGGTASQASLTLCHWFNTLSWPNNGR